MAGIALCTGILALTGCRGEMDGMPVAQLGAEQPTVSATSSVGGLLVAGFNEIVALDLESGAERPIQRVRQWGPVLVSPVRGWPTRRGARARGAGQNRGEIWAPDGIPLSSRTQPFREEER